MEPGSTIVLQVGVKALIKNKEGKYLLLRRSLRKYPEVISRWDIVGGRIEPGTPLRDNLAREMKEETGLALMGELTLIAAQDILRVPGKHIVRLTYIAEAEGEVLLDGNEHDSFVWLSRQQLEEQEGLDEYVKEILYLIQL